MQIIKLIYFVLLGLLLFTSFFIRIRSIHYFGLYILGGIIYETSFAFLEDDRVLSSSLYIVFSFLYFSFFYFESVGFFRIKQFILGLFFTTALVSLFLILTSTYSTYNQLLILALCVYLICLVLIYFIDMILHPRELQLKYEFSFWVSTGILIWSITLIFNIGSIYYLSIADVFFLEKLQAAFFIINVLVYLIYFYGMIAMIQNKRE